MAILTAILGPLLKQLLTVLFETFAFTSKRVITEDTDYVKGSPVDGGAPITGDYVGDHKLV